MLELFHSPPKTLVLGSGAYALALAQILDAGRVNPGELLKDPEPNESGGYPRVFCDLERVFMVVASDQSPAEVLRCHEGLWNWVGKLSPDGDQHELCIIFILPESAGGSFEESLALGLGVPMVDLQKVGHSVAPASNPLQDLLSSLSRTHPSDLPPLKARQAGDSRHAALKALRKADTAEFLQDTARHVIELFAESEYQLDLFCRPPSHRNGNLLRGWLRDTVASTVTPDYLMDSKPELAKWLIEL